MRLLTWYHDLDHVWNLFLLQSHNSKGIQAVFALFFLNMILVIS